MRLFRDAVQSDLRCLPPEITASPKAKGLNTEYGIQSLFLLLRARPLQLDSLFLEIHSLSEIRHLNGATVVNHGELRKESHRRPFAGGINVYDRRLARTDGIGTDKRSVGSENIPQPISASQRNHRTVRLSTKVTDL